MQVVREEHSWQPAKHSYTMLEGVMDTFPRTDDAVDLHPVPSSK